MARYDLVMDTNEHGVFFIMNIDGRPVNHTFVSWRTLMSEMIRYMS